MDPEGIRAVELRMASASAFIGAKRGSASSSGSDRSFSRFAQASARSPRISSSHR
jgi:hypothetical protein